MEGAAGARYLSTGHLLFSRGDTLRLVSFDLDRLEVYGEALQILEGIDWRNTSLSGSTSIRIPVISRASRSEPKSIITVTSNRPGNYSSCCNPGRVLCIPARPMS